MLSVKYWMFLGSWLRVKSRSQNSSKHKLSGNTVQRGGCQSRQQLEVVKLLQGLKLWVWFNGQLMGRWPHITQVSSKTSSISERMNQNILNHKCACLGNLACINSDSGKRRRKHSLRIQRIYFHPSHRFELPFLARMWAAEHQAKNLTFWGQIGSGPSIWQE